MSRRLSRFGVATDRSDIVDGEGRLTLLVPGEYGFVATAGEDWVALDSGDLEFLQDVPADKGQRRLARAELSELRLLEAISHEPTLTVLILHFEHDHGRAQDSPSPVEKITQALAFRERDLKYLRLKGAWMSEPEEVGHLMRAASSRSRALHIHMDIGEKTFAGDRMTDEAEVYQVLGGMLPEASPPADDTPNDPNTLSLAVRIDSGLGSAFESDVTRRLATFAETLGRVVAHERSRIIDLDVHASNRFDGTSPHFQAIAPKFAASARLRTLSLGVTHIDVTGNALADFLLALASNGVLADLNIDMQSAQGLDERTTVALTAALATNRSLTDLRILGDMSGVQWFQPDVSRNAREDLFLELGRNPTLRKVHFKYHHFTAADGQAFLRGRRMASWGQAPPALERCSLEHFSLADDSIFAALLAPIPNIGIRRLSIERWRDPNPSRIWPLLGRPDCPLTRLDLMDTPLDGRDIEELKNALNFNATLSRVGSDILRDKEVNAQLILNRKLLVNRRDLKGAGAKILAASLSSN